MKNLLLLLFFLLSTQIRSQTPAISLFHPVEQSAHAAIDLSNHISSYTLMLPDSVVWKRLLQDKPAHLILLLSFEGGITLELERSNPFAAGFLLTASNGSGGTDTLSYQPGLHYWGKVAGAPRSLAAISIFEDRIMGVISDAESNIDLGRINTPAASEVNMYVMFRDKHVLHPPAFECGVTEEDVQPMPVEALSQLADACIKTIRIYVECAYQVYQDNGNSISATTNFVSGLLNVVGALYQNEQIKIQLSELYIWTTPDPYMLTSLSGGHLSFLSGRPTFNGDLAHLLTTAPTDLGGIANTPIVFSCGENYAFSNIYNNYAPIPVYSWSVNVVAHETGHNLQCPHTHSCAWVGGPLDDCYPTEEGCPPGPHPANGGTIMSYCHLIPTGINFSNGFGMQPGNLIRNTLENANCLLPFNPQPDFSVEETPDASIEFTNTSLNALTYEWDFGDGQTSTLTSPVHQYAASGIYNVCLTAWDTCRSRTGCQLVSVHPCWHWQNPLPQGQDLLDLYSVDSNTAWTVGYGGLILRTGDGGTTWQKQTPDRYADFTNVYFTNNQTGWVIGNAGVIQKTANGGASWQEQASGTDENLYGMHFADNQTGWVVGSGGTILKTTDGGTTWLPQTSGTTGRLSDVFFKTAQIGWAVGEGGKILKTTNGGTTWMLQTSGVTHFLRDVFFRTTQLGWAVGAFDLLKTTNGGFTWQIQSSNATSNLTSIYFTDNQTGWAVGGTGKILKTINGGINWETQTSGTSNTLHRIHSPDNQTLWTVGGGGSILKSNTSTTTWQKQSTGNGSQLLGIDFTDHQIGWAVGHAGTILKTSDQGTRWLPQTSGTSQILRSVNFVSGQTGWIVGDGGTILKTTNGGTNWQLQGSGNVYQLNDVYFASSETGCIAGNFGLLLRTINGGVNWNPAVSGITGHLNAVFFANNHTGWVVGDDGKILKTINSGISWQTQNSGTTKHLRTVFFIDTQTGWIAGDEGTILSTQDGGATWQLKTLSTSYGFKGIQFADNQTGWAISYGSILFTFNGGTDWVPMVSGTTLNFSGLEVLDSQTAWVVGWNGAILKSGAPLKPVAQNVSYCKNAPAVPLTATGSNLRWYTMSSGGSGSEMAPTPNTAISGTTTFYVSQSSVGFGDCRESERTPVVVSVLEGPVISVSVSPGCTGNDTATALISEGAPPYTYVWSNNQTSALATGLVPGTYTVTVTGQDGCSNTNIAQVPAPPETTVLPSATFCAEDVPYTTAWGEVVSTSGLYQKAVISVFGCDSLIQQTIVVQSPLILDMGQKVLCSGENFSVCGHPYAQTGLYTETCQAFQGCDSTVYFSIVVLNPLAEITGQTINCTADTLTLHAALSPAPSIQKWIDENGQILGNGNTLTVTQSGTYIVEATSTLDGLTCTKRDTAVVDLSNFQVLNVTAAGSVISCASPGVVVSATASSSDVSFLWTGPGDFTSTTPSNEVTVPGTYTVIVTNSNGCTAGSTAMVSIEDKTGTFMLSVNPSQISAVPSTITDITVPAFIQNLEPNPIDLTWERLFVELNPDCESQVQDKIAYYAADVSTGAFTLSAGESAPLDVHFTDADTTTCCGVVRLLCRNTCTLRDTVTMVYIAGCLSGTLSPEILDLQVLPNPGSGLFNVVGSMAEQDVSIKIFAVDGKLLLRQRLLQSRAFSLENHPAGTYIIVFENEKAQPLKAMELVLVR